MPAARLFTSIEAFPSIVPDSQVPAPTCTNTMKSLSTALFPLLGGVVTASLGTPDDRCKIPAASNVYLSPGFGYELDCAVSTGLQAGLVIFVDFPDTPANDDPQTAYAEFMPGGRDWYLASSFGRLDLSLIADTGSGFLRMPARADSYGWERGLTAETHYKYVQDAVDAYIQAHGPISPVEVVYIVPTRAAAPISFSPTYMGRVSSRSGTRVAKKSVTFGMDAYERWGYKVWNHESGHTMCLPDLYPLPSGPTGQYVGGFDMMGLISGPNPDYFAWNKWRLGWLDDDQFDCILDAGTTTHTLSPVSESQGAQIKGVVIKRSGTDVLVAEVRSNGGNDSDACAQGVLVYHVSTTTATGDGPIRVFDANPGSGGCDGDELNDAPLSLSGASSLYLEEWGVMVTVVGQEGNDYTITVQAD
jgi:M6 family metalloprotease-like protein